MSYSKLSNALPSLGGILGVSVITLPTLHIIVNTILLALLSGIVGAAAGYYVKMFLDKVYHKEKK